MMKKRQTLGGSDHVGLLYEILSKKLSNRYDGYGRVE